MTPQLHCFTFSLANQSNDVLDINIDGDIVDAPTQELLREFWGDETSVSFRSFRNQIDAAKPKELNVNVNSGGGHVGDAMAMHDYLVELQSKGVKVNTKGIGIVASAATYIVMASKNSSMSENSWFMIHNVSGGIWGDVNIIENYAKTMRKFNNQIRDFYANATGQEPEQISAQMNKETWMTGKEAKEKGFVKNVTGQATFKNSIKPEHWQYANKSVLTAYNSFIQSNNSNMDLKKIEEAVSAGLQNVLEKLGLSNKKDDAAVTDAFKGFTDSLVNTLKDQVPTDEKIQELVNQAVGNALKEVPESFKNAITEATKNAVTKEDLTKSITDLSNTLTAALAGKLGNKTKVDETGNQARKINPRNRFSGAKVWSDEA
ncbi:head maturation protease, ClpP-related [Deminuibacter soli]|uniref:ATP-dependent Clp protease proteolytic subunit n=1 Tax=Deminuibacter soli TaxID=2291815 RepID=A0A3E1NQ20_9BACT|nr:head maturation protease, ClpP-related [Deminuibacter soli]RFM30026.1 Clp protease ClpP [Deminuibacter soli]